MMNLINSREIIKIKLLLLLTIKLLLITKLLQEK